MVSQSFIIRSSINELLINKQAGEKCLFIVLFGFWFFFFSLEHNLKLSLFINFIELYSLQFKS